MDRGIQPLQWVPRWYPKNSLQMPIGIYLYATGQKENLVLYIENEISAVFTALAPLDLTHKELIVPTNSQPTPITTYRRLALEPSSPLFASNRCRQRRSTCTLRQRTVGSPGMRLPAGHSPAFLFSMDKNRQPACLRAQGLQHRSPANTQNHMGSNGQRHARAPRPSGPQSMSGIEGAPGAGVGTAGARGSTIGTSFLFDFRRWGRACARVRGTWKC